MELVEPFLFDTRPEGGMYEEESEEAANCWASPTIRASACTCVSAALVSVSTLASTVLAMACADTCFFCFFLIPCLPSIYKLKL